MTTEAITLAHWAALLDAERSANTIDDRILSKLRHEAATRASTADARDSEWFDVLSKLITQPLPCNSWPLQTEVLLAFAHWYVMVGNWAKAHGLADMAIELARRSMTPSLLRRALNISGAILSKNRDLEHAIARFSEALSIAEKLGDRMGKCATIANLAEARFNAGHLHESIVLNRHAVELAGEDPYVGLVAHHNIAVASMALSDLESALRHIRAAVDSFPHLKKSTSAQQLAVMESTYARILLRLGNKRAARKRAELAKKYSERVASRASRIHAQLAEALCDAADRRADIAATRLERIRSEILPSEPAFRDFLEAELLCYEYAGDANGAMQQQKKYLQHLAESQRKCAIRQVAALQRSVRKGGDATDSELRALPIEARRLLRKAPIEDRAVHGYQQRLETIAVLAELREDATGQHSFRVGKLAFLIAARAGYDQLGCRRLEYAARLHDIGKVAVPDVILLKRGQLSHMELELMRRHSVEGCQILQDILASADHVPGFKRSEEYAALELAAQIALHHHEWWDGTGYPRRVRGDRIPEGAQITAIADVFDELIHARPYKVQHTVDETLVEIKFLSGKQFAPRFIEPFVEVVEQLRNEHGRNLEGFLTSVPEVSPFAEANKIVERIVDSARSGMTTGARG